MALAWKAGWVNSPQGFESPILRHADQRKHSLELDEFESVLGCDLPPALCQAHHDLPWGTGGDTNLATGRLLCQKTPHPRPPPPLTDQHHPNGKVTFTRRT
jgi:hypothetical protein